MTLASRRDSRRRLWALPSKPPQRSAIWFSANSPLWPNGGWPRSWARQAVSTRSGSRFRALPISRPIWAHSREWVRRVRGLCIIWSTGATTWVLLASLRRASLWSTLARSRSNGLLSGFPGGSGTQRASSCWLYGLTAPPFVAARELEGTRKYRASRQTPWKHLIAQSRRPVLQGLQNRRAARLQPGDRHPEG